MSEDQIDNEEKSKEVIESENDDFEEEPLTRDEFFKVLETVSGTEDDD